MWKQLQSLIRTKSDKAIIIEDGKPLYVVLTVEEYTHLQEQAGQGTSCDSLPATGDTSMDNNENVLYDEANQELSSVEVDEDQREHAENFANLDNAPLQ